MPYSSNILEIFVLLSIGGKPAMISGKPLHISGKPLQLIGKPGQIGLLQGVAGQTIVSAVNLGNQVCAPY